MSRNNRVCVLSEGEVQQFSDANGDQDVLHCELHRHISPIAAHAACDSVLRGSKEPVARWVGRRHICYAIEYRMTTSSTVHLTSTDSIRMTTLQRRAT